MGNSLALKTAFSFVELSKGYKVTFCSGWKSLSLQHLLICPQRRQLLHLSFESILGI